jgi:peroxiredoxin
MTTTFRNGKTSCTALPAGTRAPEFSLQTTPDQTVSLRDVLGTPVVLVFYPADWSPVCGDQLALYNEVLPEFRKHQAQILGISVDGIWCHLAYSKDRRFRFPLLSDFEPKGAVASRYGVYRASAGVAERAIFILDGEGTIRWTHVSPIGINPGAEGILSALEDLQGHPQS